MTAWGTTEKRKETGALRKGKMNYMVRVAGLEPARLQNRQIFLLLYVTIATLLCCSLDYVFTISNATYQLAVSLLSHLT